MKLDKKGKYEMKPDSSDTMTLCEQIVLNVVTPDSYTLDVGGGPFTTT
jgi:hypothetical protein